MRLSYEFKTQKNFDDTFDTGLADSSLITSSMSCVYGVKSLFRNQLHI